MRELYLLAVVFAAKITVLGIHKLKVHKVMTEREREKERLMVYGKKILAILYCKKLQGKCYPSISLLPTAVRLNALTIIDYHLYLFLVI